MGRWSAAHPVRYTPGKRPTAQEDECASRPVSQGVENLTPQRDSIPGSSSMKRVAIPTELSRPTFSRTHKKKKSNRHRWYHRVRKSGFLSRDELIQQYVPSYWHLFALCSCLVRSPSQREAVTSSKSFVTNGQLI